MRRSLMAAAGVLVLTLLAAGPAAGQQQAAGTGLLGRYFDNPDFGDVVTERLDPTIAFDWGRGIPDGIPLTGKGDTFGVVWTGYVQPEFTEEYTFTTSSDDGVRLRIDGEVVLRNLTEHAQTEDSGSVTLEAGRLHEIQLDYFDVGGEAIIFLAWESASQPRQLVPTERLYPPDTPLTAPTPVATPAPPPPPGPPDLAVVASGVSGATQAGSPLLFTATVVNQGQSPTPPGVPVSVQFLSGPGELAAAEHAGPIQPGEVVNLTSTTAWTAQEGEFQVTAEVDEVDRVDEVDEANNSVPQNLVIAPAAVPAVAAAARDPAEPIQAAILGLLVLGVGLLLANLLLIWRRRRAAAAAPPAPASGRARDGTTTVLPHAEPVEVVPPRRRPRT